MPAAYIPGAMGKLLLRYQAETPFPFPVESEPFQIGGNASGLPLPKGLNALPAKKRDRPGLPLEMLDFPTTWEVFHRALRGFMPTLLLDTYQLPHTS